MDTHSTSGAGWMEGERREDNRGSWRRARCVERDPEPRMFNRVLIR